MLWLLRRGQCFHLKVLNLPEVSLQTQTEWFEKAVQPDFFLWFWAAASVFPTRA